MSLYERIIDMGNLYRAWDKVRANHSAAGVDNITVEEFERVKKVYLMQLRIELGEERYNTKPAKLVRIVKNDKEREISILCMRDKVVQQAINVELNRIFEPLVPACSYAYRSGRSALKAVEVINEKIKGKSHYYALKTDISNFFECLSWERILAILRKYIQDERVINLIKICLQMRYVDSDGELHEKKMGVYQGSILAPILSNIYMLDFDKWLEDEKAIYIRYSDDIMLVGDNLEYCKAMKEMIMERLQTMNLTMKESKTVLRSVKDGIVFLGYNLSDKGKVIPKKATENLSQNLETMWMDATLTIEQKVKKGQEIIGGWEQYYRGERETSSIYEIVVAIYSMPEKYRRQQLEQLAETRFNLDNIHKDITLMMSAFWKKQDELSAIFDSINTDCLEIDIGLLMRKRTDSGYEWSLEL